MADPEAAVQAVQQAIDSTPEDHPDRAMYLNNLGNELKSRYARTGDIADLEAQSKQHSRPSTPRQKTTRSGGLSRQPWNQA